MKTLFALVVACTLLLAPISLYAQAPQPPSPGEEQALLQGQADDHQAQYVGDQLSTYCGPWGVWVNGPSFRVGVPIPVACTQFWSYVDFYGPTFWYPGIYLGIRGGFYGRYGWYHEHGWYHYGYGRNAIPGHGYRGAPYHGGGYTGHGGHNNGGRGGQHHGR